MLRNIRVGALLVSVYLTIVFGHPGEYDVQDPGHYLNSFLVQVSSREVAEQVAREYGFEFKGQIPSTNYFHLSHQEVVSRSKRSAEDYVNRLKEDERVHFVEQQITLKRVKRMHKVIHDKQFDFPIPKMLDNSKYYRIKTPFSSRGSEDIPHSDKFYNDQWYLHNEEQTGGKKNLDLNVERCWEQGFTGKEVVVCILDDGIDHTHKDLKRNYDPKASADFNDENDVEGDPEPNKEVLGNDHGTRCAGEIAAEADNGICGAGIAYDCNIGGIRLLDGQITDRLEATALIFKMNYIHIYSASWGPRDDGRTMEGLKQASVDAMKIGVTKGRNGKGNIYVWATGNGGDNCDHCGADGYVSSIQSISIQSLSDKGQKPYFGERCSSTMAGVPAGGEPTKQEEIANRDKIKVVTTDINNGCIENFEGTSSAAPLAAGCLALLLQAGPDLTWRDVQHLVAKYARIPGPDEAWIINGAGYHVNNKVGFGLMDCAAMIEAAQKWTNVEEQHECRTDSLTVNSEIPRSGCHKLTINFDGCQDDPESIITYLEHVEVEIELTTPRRGDIEIFITSPSGTRSELLGRRCNDDSTDGINFKFMTVHNWMENPNGAWTLEVCNNPGEVKDTRKSGNAGMFKSWTLITYGFHSNKPNEMKKSFSANSTYVRDTAQTELLRSRSVVLKRAKTSEMKKNNNNNVKGDTDLGLEGLEGLFDDISKVFGKNSMKSKRVRNPNTKQLYSRVKSVDDEKKEITDLGMEETLNEILLKLDGTDASSLYLKEILERKRKEMKRDRLRNQLISQIKRILEKDQV